MILLAGIGLLLIEKLRVLAPAGVPVLYTANATR